MKGKAFDVTWIGWPQTTKEQFIQMAGKFGCTGFGIYDRFIHIDTGKVRAWGSSGSRGSLPAWATIAIGIAQHSASNSDFIGGMPSISSPTQTMINGTPVVTSAGNTITTINNSLESLQSEIYNIRNGIMNKEEKQLKKEGKDGLYGILPVPVCSH